MIGLMPRLEKLSFRVDAAKPVSCGCLDTSHVGRCHNLYYALSGASMAVRGVPMWLLKTLGRNMAVLILLQNLQLNRSYLLEKHHPRWTTC